VHKANSSSGSSLLFLFTRQGLAVAPFFPKSQLSTSAYLYWVVKTAIYCMNITNVSKDLK